MKIKESLILGLKVIVFWVAVGLVPILVALDTLPSAQIDAQEGLEYHLGAEKDTPFLGKEEVTLYISKVGNNLVDHLPSRLQYSEFNYTFHVENYDVIGASANFGGFVYITCGTLKELRNEGELAGLLAHEIAHSAYRHEMRSKMSYSLEKLFYSESDLIIEHEWEADILAARLMLKAGYDPNDFAEILERGDAMDPPEGGVYVEHGATPDRVYVIRRIAKKARNIPAIKNVPELEQMKTFLGTCTAPKK